MTQPVSHVCSSYNALMNLQLTAASLHVIIEVAVWHMGVVLKLLSCNHTTTFNKHCSSEGQGSHALHTLPIACISSTLSENPVLQCLKHSYCNTIKIHNGIMLDYVTDTEAAEQYDWGGGGGGAKGPLASLVLLPLDRCVARLVVNIINVSSAWLACCLYCF